MTITERLLWACLFSLVWSTSSAQTGRDFDLACAIASAAEIGVSGPDTAERNIGLLVNSFYLGRLSGRDEKTYWKAVVVERLAGLKDKALSKGDYAKCLDFYTEKIK